MLENDFSKRPDFKHKKNSKEDENINPEFEFLKAIH